MSFHLMRIRLTIQASKKWKSLLRKNYLVKGQIKIIKTRVRQHPSTRSTWSPTIPPQHHRSISSSIIRIKRTCQAFICLKIMTCLIMIFKNLTRIIILQTKIQRKELHSKITSRLHNHSNEHLILQIGTGVTDLPAQILFKMQVKATTRIKTSQDSKWAHQQAGRASFMRMTWAIFKGHSLIYRINYQIIFMEGRQVWW